MRITDLNESNLRRELDALVRNNGNFVPLIELNKPILPRVFIDYCGCNVYRWLDWASKY